MSHWETIEYICKKYECKLDIPEKNEVYLIKKENLVKIFKYDVFPEVEDLLVFLKGKKINLALVSGTNKEFVDSIVSKYFDGFLVL